VPGIYERCRYAQTEMLNDKHTTIILTGHNETQRRNAFDAVAAHANIRRDDSAASDTLSDILDWIEEHDAVGCKRPSEDVDVYIDHPAPHRKAGPDDPVRAGLNDAADAKMWSHCVFDDLRHRDRDRIIRLIEEYQTIVHDARRGVTIHPDRYGEDIPVTTRSMLAQLCDTGDDPVLAASWHGGRPPIGTTSEDGELRRADNYDRVRSVLQRVENGKTSKTDAADALGCTRKTIDAALDREDLYQLQ
jgi:hypothetical protein